ncbi:hypothetical protein V6N12_045489 [Hibiscus sabdariffa]|uniref:RNase H type-1 domain-containing protein n=1 Tax=Hibiscus sabdariffa TaxID=183260 RepID=A0ABR2G2W3_9ROSI
MAEIWVVYCVLLHVWRLGISRLELETNNMEVERILNGTTEALRGNVVVDEVCELLARNWMVKITCIRRDMNKVADILASLSREKPFREVLFTSSLSREKYLDRYTYINKHTSISSPK